MIPTLKNLYKSENCSIHKIDEYYTKNLNRYIVSTPETRKICNDPSIIGIKYTRLLKIACQNSIKALQDENLINLKESETIIFNVLRGGLNFGLREALADAFDWNFHGSSFISAQRARISKDSENWHIVESEYKKVYMPESASIILGDVVATGTSLEHALHALLESAEEQGVSLRSILFFTIGGKRSEEILEAIDAECRKKFPSYEGTSVCYIEGRFTVPTINTKLNIRITGTDLIRLSALMAPEFIESQYENPAYPIERCTIYDAGSRAFWIPEYLEDVKSYWEKTLSLAKYGVTYEKLLEERFPELDINRFAGVDLFTVCEEQIKKYIKYQEEIYAGKQKN